MISHFFTASPNVVESRFPVLTDYQRDILVRARALNKNVRVETSQFASTMLLWNVEIL